MTIVNPFLIKGKRDCGIAMVGVCFMQCLWSLWNNTISICFSFSLLGCHRPCYINISSLQKEKLYIPRGIIIHQLRFSECISYIYYPFWEVMQNSIVLQLVPEVAWNIYLPNTYIRMTIHLYKPLWKYNLNFSVNKK